MPPQLLLEITPLKTHSYSSILSENPDSTDPFQRSQKWLDSQLCQRMNHRDRDVSCLGPMAADADNPYSQWCIFRQECLHRTCSEVPGLRRSYNCCCSWPKWRSTLPCRRRFRVFRAHEGRSSGCICSGRSPLVECHGKACAPFLKPCSADLPVRTSFSSCLFSYTIQFFNNFFTVGFKCVIVNDVIMPNTVE